jgi:SAM-dependent MidA family methyltransferase
VPDGSCDITAHVALDSVAAAGARAAGVPARLTDQRSVLRALGVAAGLPDRALASSDPRGYLQALQSAGQAAELTARGGLGDFGWVLQPVGVPLPAGLR